MITSKDVQKLINPERIYPRRPVFDTGHDEVLSSSLNCDLVPRLSPFLVDLKQIILVAITFNNFSVFWENHALDALVQLFLKVVASVLHFFVRRCSFHRLSINNLFTKPSKNEFISFPTVLNKLDLKQLIIAENKNSLEISEEFESIIQRLKDEPTEVPGLKK